MSTSTPLTLKQKIVTSLFSVIIMLLILEFSARCHNVYIGQGFFNTRWNQIDNGRVNIIPFRTFGKIPYKEKEDKKFIEGRHGSLYEFEKPDNTFRIVCLGGSTTENVMSYRESKFSYPLYLQKLMNENNPGKKVEVINMGFSSYSTAHSSILFQLDVLHWKPDLIILSHNINDLTASYFPKPTPDYSNKYGNHHFLPDYKSKFSTMNVLFKWSQLYWGVKLLFDNIDKKNMNFEIQRTSYSSTPPTTGVASFNKNIESIIQVAKANDIQVLLGSQPFISEEKYFDVHFLKKEFNGEMEYPLHEEFVNHHHAYNQIIKSVSENENVHFVDNDKWFEEKNEYFFDCVHYSVDGMKHLAKSYENYILENSLISTVEVDEQQELEE